VILLVGGAFPAGADPALELGERLFKAGNFDGAILEFERFVCFSSDSQKKAEVCRRIGLAYRSLGDLDQASEQLYRALAYATDDRSVSEIRVEIAVIALATKAYDIAEVELLKVAQFGESAQTTMAATFYLGVCYLYASQWELARQAFTRYYAEVDSSRLPRIESLLAPSCRPRLKSPALAKWLSTFVPGAGQIYAGDLRDGVNALAVDGGLGYLLADALLDRQYADAIVTYYPLFDRYYRGNRRRAEAIARDWNAQACGAYAETVMDAASPAPSSELDAK